MSVFQWNEQKSQAAIFLAEGNTQKATAEKIGVSKRTVERWATDSEFSAEVDRLTQMVDAAGRAHRLRIAMRAVRQKVKADGSVETNKDLLDWLKYAQSETNGIKLDL